MGEKKKLYEIFDGEELAIAEKIQQRRLQMIIHSCIYYTMDENLISDAQWSIWGKELQKLQEEHPDISEKVPYAKYFIGWDASTGMDLPIHDEWVVIKAEELLKNRR